MKLRIKSIQYQSICKSISSFQYRLKGAYFRGSYNQIILSFIGAYGSLTARGCYMWEGLKSGSLHSLNYKIYYFKQSPRVQILSSMSVGTNLVLKRRFWCLHKLSITKNCRVSKRQFRFNWKNIYLVLKCWNALLSTGHRVGAVTLLSSQSFLVLLYSPLTDALN